MPVNAEDRQVHIERRALEGRLDDNPQEIRVRDPRSFGRPGQPHVLTESVIAVDLQDARVEPGDTVGDMRIGDDAQDSHYAV